jgi:hypothetical protein
MSRLQRDKENGAGQPLPNNLTIAVIRAVTSLVRVEHHLERAQVILPIRFEFIAGHHTVDKMPLQGVDAVSGEIKVFVEVDDIFGWFA